MKKVWSEGRTKFPSLRKEIKDQKVLKPGNNNKKLGFVITAKKWRGCRIFSLTLEERATCPRSCHHWEDCYGNNMYLAHRFEHGTELCVKIEKEIEELLSKYKTGIVIRLHVLGDFYSEEYVNFWRSMFEKYDRLHVFGYTARWDDPIADAINSLNKTFPDRCVIRYSRNRKQKGLKSFACKDDYQGDSFTCLEQLGKNVSCASCALCWTTKKTVKFLTH